MAFRSDDHAPRAASVVQEEMRSRDSETASRGVGSTPRVALPVQSTLRLMEKRTASDLARCDVANAGTRQDAHHVHIPRLCDPEVYTSSVYGKEELLVRMRSRLVGRCDRAHTQQSQGGQ